MPFQHQCSETGTGAVMPLPQLLVSGYKGACSVSGAVALGNGALVLAL